MTILCFRHYQNHDEGVASLILLCLLSSVNQGKYVTIIHKPKPFLVFSMFNFILEPANIKPHLPGCLVQPFYSLSFYVITRLSEER